LDSRLIYTMLQYMFDHRYTVLRIEISIQDWLVVEYHDNEGKAINRQFSLDTDGNLMHHDLQK
jgi:hypothetical protein